MIGLNVGVSPVSAIYRGAAQIWQWPAELAFGPADRGPLIDPSRLDLLYQDAAGTIPVTAPGQPVGLVRRAAGTVDATQAVSAARPTLGRHPKAGRRNLLTRTEGLSNSVWTKQNATVSGMRLTDTTSNTSHILRREMTSFLAATYNVSFEFRAFGNVQAFTVLAFLLGGGSGSQRVNALTGEVQVGGTTVPTSITVTPLPEGWFKLSMAATYATDPSYWDIRLSNVWPIPGTSGNTYVGDGASGLDLRNIQMETGAAATAYQRVDTDLDVTEAGVPDAWYLWADGIDDYLVTTAISWASDEMTVVFAAHKASDAAEGRLLQYELPTTNGSWSVNLPGDAQAARRLGNAMSRGTVNAVTGIAEAQAQYAAPLTMVGSVQGKIGSDTLILRANGTEVSRAVTDQGSGLYGSFPLSIFRTPGGGAPFSGRLYGLLVINRLLTPAELIMTERWMASKCGVTLP